MHKKNEKILLNIADITSEGAGVGRCDDGYAVFVPGTAPGDTAEVLLIKAGKTYGIGKLLGLPVPSPMRTSPACPVFSRCGGCALRHISYADELRIKKKWVLDSFRRIGGFDTEDMEIFSAASSAPGGADRYRNKAEYPAGTGPDGTLRFGMYAPRSHRVVPCADCLLTPAFYGEIVRAAEEFCRAAGLSAYDDGENPGGIVRHLYIRDARATGEVSVSLIINADTLPAADAFVAAVRAACPACVSVSVIINKKPGNEILGDKCVILWGKETVTDVLCGLRFEISPLSFYQVNRDGAELLYTLARECTFGPDASAPKAASCPEAGASVSRNGIPGRTALPNGADGSPESVSARAGTLVDLYCGAGTIGLSMADCVRRLIGVEIIPSAVENAKKNAAANGIGNAEFFCGDAGEAAVRLASEGVRPDVLIVDPPRKGCNDGVFEAVRTMMPQKITMISCNHATGARDARRFADLGYRVDNLFAVDLFPRTAHVETVVLMSRGKETLI